MGIELIKEEISVNRIIASGKDHTVIENDVIVPDTKPDIARILFVDGDVVLGNSQAMQERLIIGGYINYNILYLAEDDDGSIKSINTRVDFSHELYAEGAKPGMSVKVKGDIEHTDFNVLNGRKANSKTIVELGWEFYDKNNHGIGGEFNGLEDIQVLKDNKNVLLYQGDNILENTVNEKLELPASMPAIKDILRTDVSIVDKDIKLENDKLMICGELKINMLFIAEDENNSIKNVDWQVPYSCEKDLEENIENANIKANVEIGDKRFNVAEDSDGELRIVEAEIDIKSRVPMYRGQTIDFIEDAYSPSVSLTMERETLILDDIVEDRDEQFSLRYTIDLPEESPSIESLYNISNRVRIINNGWDNNKLFVEGVVTNDIVYLTGNADQPVNICKHDHPFRNMYDVQNANGMPNCNIDFEIVNCTSNVISDREIEIKLSVNLNMQVIGKAEVGYISKVQENAHEDNAKAELPSIVLYYTKPNDDLWKIAKKYGTTVDKIKDANDYIDNNGLFPGKQILIPTRK